MSRGAATSFDGARTSWIPQTDFTLLGILYRLAGHQAFDAKDVTQDLRERGRRIRCCCTHCYWDKAGEFADGFQVPVQTRFAKPAVRERVLSYLAQDKTPNLPVASEMGLVV